MTPKPSGRRTVRHRLRRPATATTTAIANSTGAATSPSKATVTAIRADTADSRRPDLPDDLRHAGQPVADEHDREQRRRQAGGHQGGDRRRERHRGAQHGEHAGRGQQRHRDPVAGATAAGSARRRRPARPRCRRRRPARRRCRRRSWPPTNATSSGKVAAAMRAACSQIQSLPSWTGSDAAEMASMNAISSIVMPSVTIGASTISGTSTSRPRCCGVPAPSQGEAAAADHRRDHQADGRGHPVVDRRDRDDVHVRRGDTGRRQGDRADPPAGTGVQPGRDADERPGQHGARADADFGAQDAGLGGEHEQQHDADECDRDAGDGEDLADPARVARRPRRRCGGWRRGGGARVRRAGELRRRRVRRGGRHVRLRNGHRGGTGCGAGLAADGPLGQQRGPVRSGRPRPWRAARTSRRNPRRAGRRRRDAVRSCASWSQRAECPADE